MSQVFSHVLVSSYSSGVFLGASVFALMSSHLWASTLTYSARDINSLSVLATFQSPAVSVSVFTKKFESLRRSRFESVFTIVFFRQCQPRASMLFFWTFVQYLTTAIISLTINDNISLASFTHLRAIRKSSDLIIWTTLQSQSGWRKWDIFRRSFGTQDSYVFVELHRHFGMCPVSAFIRHL